MAYKSSAADERHPATPPNYPTSRTRPRNCVSTHRVATSHIGVADADLADHQVEGGAALLVAGLEVRDIAHQVLVSVVLPSADAPGRGVDADVGVDQGLSERVPVGDASRWCQPGRLKETVHLRKICIFQLVSNRILA